MRNIRGREGTHVYILTQEFKFHVNVCVIMKSEGNIDSWGFENVSAYFLIAMAIV